MITIALDAETHVYKDETGAIWPGVTDILSTVLGDQWAGKAGQYHLDRGHAAHALYALLGDGEDLAQYNVDPELMPYANQWRGWQVATGADIVTTERIIHHAALRYAGTLDAVVSIAGRLYVADYKASPTFRDRWQMAAYAVAWDAIDAMKIHGLASVQITPDSWKMSEPITGRELETAKREWCAIRTVYGCMMKEKG